MRGTLHDVGLTVGGAQEGSRAFTGDGAGVIKVWSTRFQSLNGDPKGIATAFTCLRTIATKEFAGRAVNSISLHPEQKMLAVAFRDNMVRGLTVELTAVPIRQRYSGMRCQTNPVHATYSPDGQYIASGSETGRLYVVADPSPGGCCVCCVCGSVCAHCVHVADGPRGGVRVLWNSQFGEALDVDGIDVGYSAPLCAIDWSPTEHCLAVCSHGLDEPIRVLCYEDPNAESDDEEDQGRTASPTGDSDLLTAQIVSARGERSAPPTSQQRDGYAASGIPSLLEIVRARQSCLIPAHLEERDALDVDQARDRVSAVMREVERGRRSQGLGSASPATQPTPTFPSPGTGFSAGAFRPTNSSRSRDRDVSPQ